MKKMGLLLLACLSGGCYPPKTACEGKDREMIQALQDGLRDEAFAAILDRQIQEAGITPSITTQNLAEALDRVEFFCPSKTIQDKNPISRGPALMAVNWPWYNKLWISAGENDLWGEQREHFTKPSECSGNEDEIKKCKRRYIRFMAQILPVATHEASHVTLEEGHNLKASRQSGKNSRNLGDSEAKTQCEAERTLAAETGDTVYKITVAACNAVCSTTEGGGYSSVLGERLKVNTNGLCKKVVWSK